MCAFDFVCVCVCVCLCVYVCMCFEAIPLSEAAHFFLDDRAPRQPASPPRAAATGPPAYGSPASPNHHQS
jgi:hypothetical protein